MLKKDRVQEIAREKGVRCSKHPDAEFVIKDRPLAGIGLPVVRLYCVEGCRPPERLHLSLEQAESVGIPMSTGPYPETPSSRLW